MSPRSKGENALEYLTESFKKKNLKPSSAFRMADNKSVGIVTAEALTRSFLQLDKDLNITLAN
jgi:hypothetical protein